MAEHRFTATFRTLIAGHQKTLVNLCKRLSVAKEEDKPAIEAKIKAVEAEIAPLEKLLSAYTS